MATAPSRPIRALTLGLLAAATLAAFAGVLRNGFVFFDDPRYTYDNPHVNQGLRLGNALWFLTHAHAENWHPLTSWSHMLDAQLFGRAAAGPHAVNLLLHVLTAALLVIVLFRFTGAWWRSAAAGALFALHPLRVESVAWISERKDVLSGLLFVLALEAYRRWVTRPSRARFAVIVAVYVVGLMAKPMLVTLPFVLVLLDVWPLGRLGRERGERASGAPARPLTGLLVEKAPLFAIAAISAVLTFVVQRAGGAVASVGSVSIGRRLTNALVSYWEYAGKSFWPSRLSAFYPMGPPPPTLGVWAAAAGLVLVTALALAARRARPYLAVGWLWFVGMLVPVIGLVQVGAQGFADRYTYLPGIGLAVAVVWAVGDLVARSRPARAAAAVACLVALAGLSVVTVRTVSLWRDTWTLFSHALEVTRENPVAHQNLGDVLLKDGQVRGALRHFAEVVRIAPGFGDAHNKLGVALARSGRYDEAIAQFRMALAIEDIAPVRNNLGYTDQQMGRLDDAIREYRTALLRDPNYLVSLAHLSQALVSCGRFAEAEAPARRVVGMRPGDREARRLLAVILVREGRIEDAIAEYRQILVRRPNDLDALNNVAWIRATHAEAAHRDGAVAVRLAERARDSSPEPVPVLFSTLAAAYAEAGRFPDAVAACERAIRLARGAGDLEQAAAFARQLACYREGRPFHFAP